MGKRGGRRRTGMVDVCDIILKERVPGGRRMAGEMQS
jgi:hypothetical protein